MHAGIHTLSSILLIVILIKFNLAPCRPGADLGGTLSTEAFPPPIVNKAASF